MTDVGTTWHWISNDATGVYDVHEASVAVCAEAGCPEDFGPSRWV